MFPTNLPKHPDPSAEPEPVKEPKRNLRGRRPEHHAPEGPTEDRMRRAEADR